MTRAPDTAGKIIIGETLLVTRYTGLKSSSFVKIFTLTRPTGFLGPLSTMIAMIMYAFVGKPPTSIAGISIFHTVPVGETDVISSGGASTVLKEPTGHSGISGVVISVTEVVVLSKAEVVLSTLVVSDVVVSGEVVSGMGIQTTSRTLVSATVDETITSSPATAGRIIIGDTLLVAKYIGDVLPIFVKTFTLTRPTGFLGEVSTNTARIGNVLLGIPSTGGITIVHVLPSAETDGFKSGVSSTALREPLGHSGISAATATN
jgi:hypothetical protein